MADNAHSVDLTVRHDELIRCQYCHRHLIGGREPVSITRIGDVEATYLPGDQHLCPGGCRDDVGMVEPCDAQMIGKVVTTFCPACGHMLCVHLEDRTCSICALVEEVRRANDRR